MFRKRIGAVLMFTLLVLLTGSHVMPEVAAPPVGAAGFMGIISGTGQNVSIAEAYINLTISLRPFPSGYRCLLSVNGWLNLTNRHEQNSTSYLLYSPSWGSGILCNLTSSTQQWTPQGEFGEYSITTLENISHPKQLPVEFHERFPSWMWSHETVWFTGLKSTLVNITLNPENDVVLHFADEILMDIPYVDYFEAGFGFSKEQITNDRTSICMRITVADAAQFHSISSYPDNDVTTTQIEENYSCEWSIAYPYSDRFLSSDCPVPIRAGCSSYITINQYNPPSQGPTTPSTTALGIFEQTDWALILWITLAPATILMAIIGFIFYSKRT